MLSNSATNAVYLVIFVVVLSFNGIAEAASENSLFEVSNKIETFESGEQITTGHITLSVTNTASAAADNIYIGLFDTSLGNLNPSEILIGDLSAGETRTVQSEITLLNQAQTGFIWKVKFDSASGSNQTTLVYNN